MGEKIMETSPWAEVAPAVCFSSQGLASSSQASHEV